MKISTFCYSLGQGIKNLFHNKGYSAASIATISACLFLFGMFYSILINFNHILHKAEEDLSVTCFFVEGTTEEQILQLKVGLEERPEVKEVIYVTADEAWESFKAESLGEYADGFTENPLEGSDNLEIYLADVTGQAGLVEYLQSLEMVREVNYSELTANALSGANSLLTYITIAIIAILFLVSIFLINNTIATGITSHKDEIEIMKYIGATDFFVRAPYVFEGLIIGIIGSLIPLGLVYYIYNKAIEIILGRFSILSNLLQFLPVQDIFVNLVPIISALGVGIGMLGSMMTIRKHLRV